MIQVEQVELRSSSSKANNLELANSLAVNFSDGEYQIKAGCRNLLVNVKFSASKSARNILYLSDNTLQKLLLPKGIVLNLKYEIGSIILGPLLGIFISDADLPKLIQRDCSDSFMEFQDRINGKSLCYFFVLKDVCWESNKVKAYYWCTESRWDFRFFPLPEIIYDRSFEKGARSNASKLRGNIAQKYPTVKILNEPTNLRTLEVFNHLSNYSDIKDHLPIVVPFSYDNLLTLLDKESYLYIKPNVFFEEGVVGVTKEGQNFLIEFRDQQRNQVIPCTNADSLIKQLKTMLKVSRKYVLQTRLGLANFLGNSFILRVLLQKTPALCWEATEIIAKIAPSGSNTASCRYGGRVMRAKEVLALSFPDQEAVLIKKCKLFAKLIGYKVEEQFGSLIELEIDVGIDVAGKLWLIQVNDKPSKVDFSLMGDQIVTNLVNQIPLLTSFSLAGFDITNRDKFENNVLPQELFTLKELKQESHKKQLFLNDYQLKMLNLTPGKTLALKVGVTEFTVEVEKQMTHSSQTVLYLSSAAYSELPFYQGESLRLVFLSSSKLFLGPSLGLTVPKDIGKYINKISAFKKRAVLALEKGMFLYCFHLDSVDWKNNLVNAYCFNPTSSMWQKKTMPVPQVIDDRGSYPGPKTVEGYPHQGKNHTIQWINTTRTFGKWETYQALTFFKETTKYLPVTTLLTLSTLEQFLKKYKYSFIKHNYGRNGLKVLRIEKAEKHYLCKTGGSVVKSWRFAKLAQLFSFLCETLGKNLILQQGIFLAQIGDSPFDMRILVQKNSNSEWTISALNFRIAKPGAIVTNFAAGAKDVFLSPGEELLHAGLSWESLKYFTLQTVYAMETFFGSLGEIGLDVGLDRDGKLWLIEANSRPSSIAYRKATTEASNQIFGLPLEYASSLVRRLYNNFET
jgi:hypothetical protein